MFVTVAKGFFFFCQLVKNQISMMQMSAFTTMYSRQRAKVAYSSNSDVQSSMNYLIMSTLRVMFPELNKVVLALDTFLQSGCQISSEVELGVGEATIERDIENTLLKLNFSKLFEDK